MHLKIALPSVLVLLAACSGNNSGNSASDGTGVTTVTATEPTTSTTQGTAPTTSGVVTDTGATTGGADTIPPVCPDGAIVCESNIKKVCDGMGGFSEETPCDNVCVDGLGCLLCNPGEGVCEGDVAHVCNDAGDGYVDTYCDDVQGVTCDPDLGHCVGACAPADLGTSYIGCDYYPTVTTTRVDAMYHFAVVVSNTTDESAHVTITRGAMTVTEDDVPSQSVKAITLPWVSELKDTSDSMVVPDGAYRVRSTQPITLYQYSPIEYVIGDDYSMANDASLLVPVNAWSADYWVAIRNTHGGWNPGSYAVIASQDGTKVTVTPSATGKIVNTGGGIAADGTGVVMLNEGDVLQVLSGHGGGEPAMPDVSDLTGTHVTADKPIHVIAAHFCTYIPFDVEACDHLEESMLPYESLAREYLVTTPFVKPLNQDPFIKPRMVRVIATEAGTTISYEPPQDGAPTALANPGDYFEITATDKDFMITASAKVVVAEYMQGQQAGGMTGDPAMTIAVPIKQYRTDYLFHAPTNYESSFVNVTAPIGASITLDGMPLPAPTPIGNTGYGVIRVQVSNAGDGTHSLTGDQQFGIQVYGYGQYTSYWYPGGANLKFIPNIPR